MKTIAIVITATLLAGTAGAQTLDRIEDRRDRIESRIDRQIDRGPRDRVEDVIDRRESLYDVTGMTKTGRRLWLRERERSENPERRRNVYDRREDRRDGIESRIDRRFDRGPRDRIEDVVDRRESIRDRRN